MHEEHTSIEGLAMALYAAEGESFARLRPWPEVPPDAQGNYRRMAMGALDYLRVHPDAVSTRSMVAELK